MAPDIAEKQALVEELTERDQALYRAVNGPRSGAVRDVNGASGAYRGMSARAAELSDLYEQLDKLNDLRAELVARIEESERVLADHAAAVAENAPLIKKRA